MGFPQRQRAVIRMESDYSNKSLNQNPDNNLFALTKMTPDDSTPLPTNFTITSHESPLNHDLPTLTPSRMYSFQAPPQQSAQHFCENFLCLHALNTVRQLLTKVGKRMLDANAITLNSTQKQMVQTIVQTNKNRTDDKSKYLTQRANKFLKIIWKTQKYSDPCLRSEPIKKEEKVPRYASPIRQFKEHRLTRNNSFGTSDQPTSRTKSAVKHPKESSQETKPVSKAINKQKEGRISIQTPRVHHFNSEERKFEKIRLTPNVAQPRYKPKEVKQVKEVPHQKSFEIDLTQNITWKTMLTTKNFQNMLKVLK